MSKMQKPKKGHVVRVSERAWSVIASKNATAVKVIDELIEENIDLEIAIEVMAREHSESKVYYVLPTDLFDHIEDARGKAILESVRSKKKKTVEPIEVRGSGK